MSDLYIKYPKNIKSLGREIVKIADDYWTGKISESIAKEYLYFYASNTSLMAENGNDINPTIKLIIGKKRLSLLLKLLENYKLN